MSHMHIVHSDSTYLQSILLLSPPIPINPPLRLPLVFLSFCFDSLCDLLSLTNNIDMCLSIELSNGCGGWTCGYITKVNDSFSSHTQQQPIVPQREVETSSICDLMLPGPALRRPNIESCHFCDFIIPTPHHAQRIVCHILPSHLPSPKRFLTLFSCVPWALIQSWVFNSCFSQLLEQLGISAFTTIN